MWGTSGSSESTSANYIVMRQRPVWVEWPAHYSRDDILAFCHLVNHRTTTCGLFEALVEGRVTILDPNTEVRTLKDFLPLMKQYASAADRALVNAFIAAHPLDGPDTTPEG